MDANARTPSAASAEPTPRQRWLVIGGGVMGMTLAHRLSKRGQDVVLAEAAPTMGGLTSGWKLGEVTWDRFYHVTLMSDTHLRGILEELDLEKELKWVETKTGFYADGKLHSMSNTVEFLKFPPLSLIQKLRLGGTIFLASKLKNWRRLERVPVERWLRRYSGSGVFEKIWQPLLRAKLGETYKRTSAAFIWAHTQRMYKARKSGMKKEMFGYVPGGYARILDVFSKRLVEQGVTLLPGHAAGQIVRRDDGKLHVDFGDGRHDAFDNVISTIASPLISRTCPQLSEAEHQKLQGVEYIGVVCASMLMKEPISPYYVTNIVDTWVPLTAVIEMGTIVDHRETGGHSLVYLPKYLPSDDPALQESDETIRERMISTLEKMYPHFKRDNIAAFQIARAKYVMALPTLEYSTRLPPITTSVEGFYALNSAHILKGNLNVNETTELADEKLDAEVWPDFCKRVAARGL
jgi:protoporphyrinogen oxidase